MLKDVCDNNPNDLIITERSLYTDKYVFAQNNNLSKENKKEIICNFRESLNDISIAKGASIIFEQTNGEISWGANYGNGFVNLRMIVD
jgi:hypothetical protein